MKYLPYLLILFCSIAIAGEYVCYDENGYITDKHYSVDGNHSAASNPNCIKITRNEFKSLTKWHKVENGQIVIMSQAEKDAILAQEEADKRQRLLDRIDKYEVSNLDLLTALVKRINVRIPSNKITKQEIVQQLKSDLGL